MEETKVLVVEDSEEIGVDFVGKVKKEVVVKVEVVHQGVVTKVKEMMEKE